MNFTTTFRGNLSLSSHCSSCCGIRFQPILPSLHVTRSVRYRFGNFSSYKVSRFCRKKREIICRVTDTQTEPDNNDDDKDKEVHEGGENQPAADSHLEDDKPQSDFQLDSPPQAVNQINGDDVADIKSEDGVQQDADDVEVATGSPLPGVKPQQLDESIRIPKEIIDILKDQVFGFDTFFVTNQEPYEGGVLFKGNLRGQAATSYEKISTRLKNKFGDQYKLFLLVNPEDDKPVAVVVPRKTLQPETTAVPEWFAAGAFGLVTVFTLLLRNVPALQSNLLSTFDNLNLLTNGLPGALVTALIIGVHELGHILAAKSTGVELGVPYFVPSWQVIFLVGRNSPLPFSPFHAYHLPRNNLLQSLKTQSKNMTEMLDD